MYFKNKFWGPKAVANFASLHQIQQLIKVETQRDF